MSVEKACNFAKVSKVTYYEWLKEHEDFRTEMAFAESIGIRRVTKKVEDKDPWKILKNKDPKNFKDVQTVLTDEEPEGIDYADGSQEEI